MQEQDRSLFGGQGSGGGGSGRSWIVRWRPPPVPTDAVLAPLLVQASVATRPAVVTVGQELNALTAAAALDPVFAPVETTPAVEEVGEGVCAETIATGGVLRDWQDGGALVVRRRAHSTEPVRCALLILLRRRQHPPPASHWREHKPLTLMILLVRRQQLPSAAHWGEHKPPCSLQHPRRRRAGLHILAAGDRNVTTGSHQVPDLRLGSLMFLKGGSTGSADKCEEHKKFYDELHRHR